MAKHWLDRVRHTILAVGLTAPILAACGGGSGGTPTNGNPSGGSAPGGSSSIGSTFPKDYAMPYFGSDGLYVAPASSPGTSTRVVAGPIKNFVVITGGEYRNGTINNERPYAVVYYQNGQWFRLGLRNGASTTPVLLANDSAGSCPGILNSNPDYQVPEHSYVLYTVAGSDGTCTTATGALRAIRLDDTPNTPVRTIDGTLIRTFFGTSGEITGFAAQSINSLGYYDAGLTTYKKLYTVGNRAARNAASFARTATTAYLSYQDAQNTSYIVTINADGTAGPVLYSAANTVLNSGIADSDAMYVLAGTTGSVGRRLVRVAFGSGATTDLGLVPGAFVPLGVTRNAVIVDAALDAGGETLYAIPKLTGGTLTTLATGSYGIDLSHTIVTDDRIYWGAYDGSSDNGTITGSRAGITTDSGTVVEQYANSEWVITVEAGKVDLTRPGHVPAIAAGLLRGYTGNYNVDGHLGGTLAYYDFVAGTKADYTTIGERYYLRSYDITPVGLASYDAASQNGQYIGDGAVTYVAGTSQLNVLLRPAASSKSGQSAAASCGSACR